MSMLELLQCVGLTVIIQIILIDQLLSADNAMAIALACRNLDARQQRLGLLLGTAGAVLMRLALIFVALNLMSVPGLKIVAALLLGWVAVGLLKPRGADHAPVARATTLLVAVKAVVIADFVMSLDNVLAVASAVELGAPAVGVTQQLMLVLLGLVISVPVMLLGASLFLKLFERLPLLVFAGVGLLGWIAAGLLISDSFVVNQFGQASVLVTLVIQAVGALLTMALARRAIR